MATNQSYSALDNEQDGSERDLNSPDHQVTTELPVDTHATETPLETETEKKQNRFDWGGSWIWEIGSALLSVVGLILLITFLARVNNTPYAGWQYTASPNTVVSIITTITKAALLGPVSACLSQLKWNLFRNPSPLYYMQAIDQASRGPIGSLEVLLRGIFGLKTGKLTLLGAFLTILALAVDPFAQQILKFPSRAVPAPNESAEVQSAYEYTSPVVVFGEDMFIGLPPSFLTTIMSGISQTNSPLEPQCSSGFCEYPEFVTMGICSHCEDVTKQTNQTCLTQEDSSFLRQMGRVFKDIPINCTYTSPDNFSFAFSLDDGINSGSFGPDDVTFRVNYWTSRPRTNEPTFEIRKPVFSFMTANYSLQMSWTRANVKAPPPKPSLTQCAMYYCERRYAASSYKARDQGKLSPHISNTQQLVPKDTTPDGYQYSDSFVYFGPPDGKSLFKNSTYAIDVFTFDSLTATMMDLFNSTLDRLSEYSKSNTRSMMATILRTSNLDQLLDSISTSLTDLIRANSRSDGVPGEAFRVEAFIEVRWPWIVLPAMVILGSIGLLLGTAMASKQQHAVLWKGSVLPLLSSELKTTPENDISSLRNVDEMQRVSMHIQATAIQEKGPLRVIEEAQRFR